MKKSVITLLFLAVVLNINSQSTERFIRIIGNSNTEIKSDSVRVNYNISEIVANERLKTTSKSYASVYDEFIESLIKVGFQEKDLKKTVKLHYGRFNKVESEGYFIVANPNKLESLMSLHEIEGCNPSFKYKFTSIDDSIEEKLSIDAINDAKRKAKKICNEIGMKLGKILNIEDKSSISNLKDSNKDSTLKTYRVSITFKLID